MSDLVRGEGGARPVRRADAEQWLPSGFEIEDEGPPVGSIAVGAFGIGFDLIEPGRGVTQSYDPAGNEVSESLAVPLAAEGLPTIGGAEDTSGAPWTVEGLPEGQEEALERTALPGRVELDGHTLESDR